MEVVCEIGTTWIDIFLTPFIWIVPYLPNILVFLICTFIFFAPSYFLQKYPQFESRYSRPGDWAFNTKGTCMFLLLQFLAIVTIITLLKVFVFRG